MVKPASERSARRGAEEVRLPPGQRLVDGFPRFGTHFGRPAPPVPADSVLTITGAVTEPVVVPLAELASLPPRHLNADFHCVSGWSATGLHWEGVAFAAFYRHFIEPAVPEGVRVSHLSFGGLDGYRSTVLLEDALTEDVLLADRLNEKPLDSDHGAPLRLVSPRQYGFMSTKHLCEVSLHTSEPAMAHHPRWLVDRGLRLVKPHPRARVWEEERHRYVPGWVLRPAYRLLIEPFRRICASGGEKL